MNIIDISIGILFKKFQEHIKFLKEFYNIDLLPNGKGYYLVTYMKEKYTTICIYMKNDQIKYVTSKVGETIIIRNGENEGKVWGKGILKYFIRDIIIEGNFKDIEIIYVKLDFNEETDVEIIFSLYIVKV